MKDYMKGILGGILGGLIATIPWVLMYVYGGYILSLLAALIAAGVYYGYKLFRGTMGKKLPIIIAVISIVIVVLTTTVIIPLFMLHEESFPVTLDNLMLLYENSDFVADIIKDLAISVIFTFLGIGGVLSKVKAEIGTEK